MANQIQVLLSLLRDSYSLFKSSGEVAHLQDAIQDGHNTLSQISLESPHYLTFLIIFGELFAELYDQLYDLNCLTKTIGYYQEAVDLTPKGDPDRAGYLSNLSHYLSTRCEREGKQEDLTQAIGYCQEAVDLTPKGDPDRAYRLNNLSNQLSTRYEREGKQEDLTQAIGYCQEAVDLTPKGNPNRAGRLNNLSNHLSTRYEREGKQEDLTQAIGYYQEAIDLTPKGDPDRACRLNNLSDHLSMRYRREGKQEDLTQAIGYYQEAVDLTPKGDPDRAGYLSNLSHHLSTRYEREGKQEDLTQAIGYCQEAVDLTPKGDPDRAYRLNNLSNQLSTRYEREGKQEDLTQAIGYCQEAVDLTPKGDPDRAGYLSNLSHHLSTRYEREGKQEDLTQAIEYYQEAVGLTPKENPDRAAFLNNLSHHLSTRYEREGKQEDLTQAIEYYQEAVGLTPKENPDRASRLNNLSDHLSMRYRREGKQEDLTQAIGYCQEAVDLTPKGDPGRAGYLNNLSIRLSTRYEREGKQEDLTQAIGYCQEADDLIPKGNPNRAAFLNNLSNHLSTRYEREGKQEDLTQAIRYCQEAVDLTPKGNPNRACRLNNLSHHLSTQYEREGKQEDLIQAIGYCQEAVDLTPKGNPDRARHLSNLSHRLSTRYRREGKQDNLIQAIGHCQEAVDLTPKGGPNRAGYLNNLSIHLSTRYEREGKQEDLTQAIGYCQEAVELMPKGNPERAAFLNNVSIHLSTRYRREGKQEDLTQAIKYSQEACECLNSPPSLRLHGCQIAVDLLTTSQRWHEAQNLLKNGFNVLPFLISHLSSKLDQEHMMKSISGLAAIGCAVSLQCDNDGYNALEILESGRGTINRLIINSRNDLAPLYESYPHLAKRFENLRTLVNAPSESRENAKNTIPARSTLVSELNELMSEIRTKEGFENFQALPSKDQLLDTAAKKTRVVLNTTHFRTDAIIIDGNGHVQTLPLNQSVFQNSSEYYGKLQNRFGYNDHGVWAESNAEMRNFLEWLWDQVVDPVLNAFQLKPLKILYEYDPLINQIEADRLSQLRTTNGPRCPDSDQLAILHELMKQQLNITSSANSPESSGARFRTRKAANVPYFPRIHWIGVGHMGAFPFHAAGYGSQDLRKNTMSCVVSSYASTLTALAFAERKRTTLKPSASKLLLVTMPKTPNESNLPGVAKEAQIIQETAKILAGVKLRELAPVQVVLNDLPLFNAVHFACHGYADPRSPFRGGLLLCGDEPEKSFDENTQNNMLTVESICSVNTEDSQLAFLSACCTAENASSRLIDEGIHLANGFQLAGFPHVIASLWEADDVLSVTIAEKFYQIMFDQNNVTGHDKVAYALHDAALAARRICDDPLSWATTVHFGP